MSHSDPTLPDTGELCCYGAAVGGPAGCTCWVERFDLDQQPPKNGRPVERARMCADCAFRPGSPERSGVAGYQLSGDGEIEDLVYSTAGFACHHGMRRVVELVHPSRMRFSRGAGDYAPLVRGGVAFKADGTPADLCAGLAAARRAAVTDVP